MISGGRVQVVAGEQPRFGPVALVPALALDPLGTVPEGVAGWGLRSPTAQGFLHRLEGGQAGQRQLAAAQRPALEVNVRVGQARQHPPAAQVDDLRMRSGQGQDLGIAAHSQDAPGLHGDGGRVGEARVLRPNLAVEEKHISHSTPL